MTGRRCDHPPEMKPDIGQCRGCRSERRRERRKGIPALPGQKSGKAKLYFLDLHGRVCWDCGATEDIVVDHDRSICPQRSHVCRKCFRAILCRSCNNKRGH